MILFTQIKHYKSFTTYAQKKTNVIIVIEIYFVTNRENLSADVFLKWFRMKCENAHCELIQSPLRTRKNGGKRYILF